jgi:hypothetical protein
MSDLSIKKERFSGLRYSVHKEKGDLLKAFPDLAGIPSFVAYHSTMKYAVIKYVIFMYDKGSEFIKEYPDLDERKEAVAEEVGWAGTSGVSKTIIQPNHKKIMNLQHPQVLAMILDYIALQNSRALKMIHVNEQLFAEYTELLMKPILENKSKKIDSAEAKIVFSTVDIKKKFRDECGLIKEDLDALYLEVYGDNWDVNDKIAETKVISMTPEFVGNIMNG